jgi:acyl-homoserine-lactone acylase
MQPHPIDVQVLQGDGSVATVSRTLYDSQYGPIVNLGGPLDWSDTTAIAIRDINADNYRAFRSWLGWGQAGSLDDFIAVQREFSAVPWVNTVAVGRGDARAWYGDIGTMPNVSPEQAADCSTPLGQAVAGNLPSGVPSLLREDYVANMNDSHWLANPAQPLTGFPAIVGPEGSEAQSFRTRLGHLIAQGRIDGTDGAGPAGATVDTVKSVVLGSRVYTAELFKDEALAMVCTTPPPTADVGTACDVLAAWNDTGNTDARGAHVWDEFWNRANDIDPADLYAVPFDPADPVNTPRGLKPTAAAALATKFQEAVAYVASTPYALDAPRGDYLFVTRAGSPIGLYGGCGGVGYFTIACSDHALDDGGYSMDFDPNGNSYMQIVRFTEGGGVEAHTFLTHGEPEDPASPVAAAYTQAYAQKAWVRQPFTESEIAASPGLQTLKISE